MSVTRSDVSPGPVSSHTAVGSSVPWVSSLSCQSADTAPSTGAHRLSGSGALDSDDGPGSAFDSLSEQPENSPADTTTTAAAAAARDGRHTGSLPPPGARQTPDA